MEYNPSRTALYHPEKQDALPAALFAGKRDALCAELARLAYFRFEREPQPLVAALAAHGLTQFAGFVDTAQNSQAFACQDATGDAWLAFRGTQSDSLKDLIIDGMAWKGDWGGIGRVHSGFAQAYCGQPPGSNLSLREQVREWLAAAQPQRVILTGHSLGAALATLCAADNPAAELVTFGSPRVGDAAFCAAFAGRRVRRYQDCADLVARIPPANLGFGHVGELHYINRNGAIALSVPEDAIAEDVRMASRDYLLRYAWRWGNVLVRNLADHAPINYVTAVLGIRGA